MVRQGNVDSKIKRQRPSKVGGSDIGSRRFTDQGAYRLGKPQPAQTPSMKGAAATKAGLAPLNSRGNHETRRRRTGTPTSASTKTIIPATPYWYDIDLPLLDGSDHLEPLPADAAADRISRAAQLHDAEVEAYTKSDSGATVLGMSASDATFLSRILTSGTLSDRLSALTLLVQSSPVHNTRALDALKSMAAKRSREESLKAIRAISDWWIGGGAPSRKLRYIRDQPLHHPHASDKHLLIWYFEDWLKKYFFSVLQILETLLLDPLPFVRTQAMALVAQLLNEKPEQEQNLLRLLVNKLGDPERTVASKASYHLLQLLQAHPAMKIVVVREITALVLRAPSTSTGGHRSENKHAKYYGVITFNQITLQKSDVEVSRTMVDVYFDIFREILGEPEDASHGAPPETFAPTRRQKDKGKAKAALAGDVEDENSKMIAAILTGVNRAMPFADLDHDSLNAHVDVLFRITHSATFNISVQALVLVFHVMAENKAIVDRFYRTLYESLFDPRLLTSSKQTMYLNLLFRAIKADSSLERQMAFVKRIFQSLSLHQPPFICGAIYLLGELFSTRQELRGLLYAGSILQEPSDPLDAARQYDPRKREPLYAHASCSRLWEIHPFLTHFHPSVSLHTRQLLEEQQITATADLGLNTIMHFLDRFVYRNPKKPKPKGASAMQPTLSDVSKMDRVRHTKGYQGQLGIVNDPSFWQQKAAAIPVDQLFFHQYFAQKSGRHQAKLDKVNKRKKVDRDTKSHVPSEVESEPQGGKAEQGGGSDDGHSSLEGSADEDEIWKVMKASIPGYDDGPDESDIDPMDDDLQDISDLSSDSSDDEEGSGQASELEDSTGKECVGGESDEDMDFPTFDEEEDDLVNLDEEVDEPSMTGKRRAPSGSGKRKRRKLGQLPTFATYEDYRDMIEAAPDENI